MVGPSLYLDRDTFVHRLDPRTKMSMLLCTLVLAFVFANPLYSLIVPALVLFFGYLSRSLANLRRIWALLLAVAIVSIALWSIFCGGQTPLFLFVERESLMRGIGIALGLDATIMAVVIFLSTTRNEEVAAGLVRLGLPYRFAFAVSRALRLIPMMFAAGHAVGQSRRSRGLDLDSGNALGRFRKRLPLLVPAFAAAARSNNVLSVAMASRGFGAGSGRTYISQADIGRADILVLLVLVLLLAGSIVLRFMGFGGLG